MACSPSTTLRPTGVSSKAASVASLASRAFWNTFRARLSRRTSTPDSAHRILHRADWSRLRLAKEFEETMNTFAGPTSLASIKLNLSDVEPITAATGTTHSVQDAIGQAAQRSAGAH